MRDYKDLILQALSEDLGAAGDITSNAIFPHSHRSKARIIARENGILSGMDIAAEVLETAPLITDGTPIKKGDVLLEINAQTKFILSHERVALNYLQHLSGIATETAKYVEAAKDYPAKITCTRKTLPNMRALQKKAVRDGGGTNHRFGLYDAVMIKDNHIAACDGDINEAINRVKANVEDGIRVEVEVDTLEQLSTILDSNIDVVLLDNMAPAMVSQAITMIGGRFETEASGGITLERIEEFAKTGVNYISIGALTHSVKALDIGLDFE